MRSNLAKTLVEVRSGKAGASQLEVIRSDFENGHFSLQKVIDIINSFHNVVEKTKFADILAKEGVAYIGLGASIETEQIKNLTGDIYVLFFGNKLKQSDQQLWSGNRHLFHRRKKSYNYLKSLDILIELISRLENKMKHN